MSINNYAKYIMHHLGVNLKIINKDIKFDGTYRKLMNSSLAKKYGWKYKTKLDVGLSITINDYLKRLVFKKISIIMINLIDIFLINSYMFPAW